jgi:ribonuclease HII
MKRKERWIIGIDEVGRGALAGPVMVAAALVPYDFFVAPVQAGVHASIIKDSKKLSPKQREAWFLYFKESLAVDFAVARVYPRGIEKMNISRAANLAALRAYKRLIANGTLQIAHKIFLDGGLFLGRGAQPKNAKTIVKGDEKIPAVAIASIVAKVSRDHFMVRLAKKYPEYGFEAHKGYGTKKHYKALKKHGPCEAHRKTFLS